MEVCVDNLQSVSNALEGGAKRLELCSALSEGGLTPTIGFVKQVCSKFCQIQVPFQISSHKRITYFSGIHLGSVISKSIEIFIPIF